jgi:hypothetical protein
MQINMRESGTYLFISDHCHVIENWRDGIPQGWLARDHPAWWVDRAKSSQCSLLTLWLSNRFRSTQRLKQLERLTKGKVIPGHDEFTFLELQAQQIKNGGFFM